MNGDYETRGAAGSNQRALNTVQRAVLDPYAISLFEVGPGHRGCSRLYNAPYYGDLLFFDGTGDATKTDDRFDTRRGKDGEAVLGVQTAKEVAGKKGGGNLFQAIGIPADVDISGQQRFKALRNKGFLRF